MTEDGSKPGFVITVKPYAHSLQQLADGGRPGLDPRVVAEDLRKSGPATMPSDIADWLADWLEGTIPARRGRPAMSASIAAMTRMVRKGKYQRIRDWLQRRKDRYGHLDGWSALRGKGWWQGPPAERAARIVAEAYGPGYHSWRSIQTQASKKSG